MTPFNVTRSLIWLIPIGFEFVIEMICLIWPQCGWQPLTRLIRYLPFDVVVLIMWWFWWHFADRYFLPEWLRNNWLWAIWLAIGAALWFLIVKPRLPQAHY